MVFNFILGIDKDLASAASKVGAHIGQGNEEVARKTESDLLKQLRNVAKETHEAREKGELKKADEAMGGLFDNIKVEKQAAKPKKKQLTPEQQAFLEKRRQMRRDQGTKSSDASEGTVT